MSRRAIALVVALGACGLLAFVVLGLGVGDRSLEEVADRALPSGEGDRDAATTTTTLRPEPSPRPEIAAPDDGPITFSCDFTVACPLDQFVQYRDAFVVHEIEGQADHARAADATFDNPICTAPEETRPWSREQPHEMTYRCIPGGNLEAAHQMSVVPDTSGYTFTGSSPNLVFEDVERISFSVNMTSAGSRNFWEVAIIPADEAWVDGMPCIRDLPCNDSYDYDDLGAIGFGNSAQKGSGFDFASPERPDGFEFEHSPIDLDDGDIRYPECTGDEHCFRAQIHRGQVDVRARYGVVVEVRDDGIWFGQEDESGQFHWIVAEGAAMPEGPVRVVLKFHGYTPTKSRSGPGYDGNLSASVGGFTWHWDDFEVVAGAAVASAEYYGDLNPERFTTSTAPECLAFAQGQRDESNRTILPVLVCPDEADIDADHVEFGQVSGALAER